MTYKIIIDGRKIETDDDVPKLLDYGRTAAGFIHVTATDGLDALVNVAHIVAVLFNPHLTDDHIKSDLKNHVSAALNQIIGDTESDERIIIDKEESR